MTSLSFPLSSSYSDIKTSWVKFSAIQGERAAYTITLPMPIGIEFGDTATYNTVDLGLIGGGIDAVKSAIKQAKSADGTLDAVAAATGELTKGLGGMLKGENIGLALSQIVPNDTIRKAITLESKRVINPDTNTLFSNVEIRTFSFSFTMIAESKEESVRIRQIVDVFRRELYPELEGARGVVAKFPKTWDIGFYYGTRDSAERNTFIPKIHRCFLQNFSSTYNSSNNSWHADGAPLEVACSLTFTETKTYSYNSILTGEES